MYINVYQCGAEKRTGDIHALSGDAFTEACERHNDETYRYVTTLSENGNAAFSVREIEQEMATEKAHNAYLRSPYLTGRV